MVDQLSAQPVLPQEKKRGVPSVILFFFLEGLFVLLLLGLIFGILNFLGIIHLPGLNIFPFSAQKTTTSQQKNTDKSFSPIYNSFSKTDLHEIETMAGDFTYQRVKKIYLPAERQSVFTLPPTKTADPFIFHWGVDKNAQAATIVTYDHPPRQNQPQELLIGITIQGNAKYTQDTAKAAADKYLNALSNIDLDWTCRQQAGNNPTITCEKFVKEIDQAQGYGASVEKNGNLNIFTCRIPSGSLFYSAKKSCIEAL